MDTSKITTMLSRHGRNNEIIVKLLPILSKEDVFDKRTRRVLQAANMVASLTSASEHTYLVGNAWPKASLRPNGFSS